MRKNYFILSIIFVLLIFISVSCSLKTPYNRAYVSDSILKRSGQSISSYSSIDKFQLPPNVALANGLSAHEAVAIALWNNAKFQADLVSLGFARADLVKAGMLQNPILSLLFPLGPKQLEATLNLSVDFLWRRPKRIVFAKLQAEQVAENLVQNGLNLILEVMTAYSEIIFQRDRAKIIGEEASLQAEIAAIARVRLDSGDISLFEETAFRLEAERKREMLVGINRDVKLAESRLKLLMGAGSNDSILTQLELPVSRDIQKSVDDLVKEALAARPDLRAAEIAIESAGVKIGWARSDIFKLTASLDANAEGKEGFELGPGLSAELPILNQNRGEILQAKAQLEQASRMYVAVKQKISQQVVSAFTRYHAARKALKILREDILPAASIATRNAGDAYMLGEISYLELLEFRRQLLNSRLRQAEAEVELRRAEAGLYNSIGFRPDFKNSR